MNRRVWTPLSGVLTLIAVAGLAIDAIVHLAMANTYDGNRTSALTQGDLFRAEAAIAIIVGLLLLFHLRRWTVALAFLTGAGGAILVTIYRYVNVGRIGIIPNMYESTWTPPYADPWKVMSLWAEVATALASLALFVVLHRQARSTPTAGKTSVPTPTGAPAH